MSIDTTVLDILSALDPTIKTALVEHLKKLENEKKVNELGDSGILPENLSDILEDEAKNSNATDPRRPNIVTSGEGLESSVKQSCQSVLETLAPLSPETALKWKSVLEEIFESYPKLLEILTTKNYNKGDFKKKQLRWKHFEFFGTTEILTAAQKMDLTILNILRERKLIFCIPKLTQANVRDVWMKVHSLERTSRLKVYECYLDDTVDYWTLIPECDYISAAVNYIALMNLKYPPKLVEFMEQLGFGTIMSWRYFRKTSLTHGWIKNIHEQYKVYEKTGKGNTYGIISFVKTLEQSESYNEIFDKHGTESIQYIMRQKKNMASENEKKRHHTNHRYSQPDHSNANRVPVQPKTTDIMPKPNN